MQTIYSIFVDGEFYETWETEQDAFDRLCVLARAFNNVTIYTEIVYEVLE